MESKRRQLLAAMGRSAYFSVGGERVRADRYEALLDFLLAAVAVEGTAPFPPHLLTGLRQVARCETVAYREWSPHEMLEDALAADEPQQTRRVWAAYRHVRQHDPLPGYASGVGVSPLPDRGWPGQVLAISDFMSDREFRSGALYAEICKPRGVRAVMKAFLPTGGATGASVVFETTRSRFDDSDRAVVQRLVPLLAQLRRNAHARTAYQEPRDSTAPDRARLQRLTPREQVVLARAAAGETNTVIAQALFVSPGTVRKHLEHIYDKLEVHTRTQAAAIYIQERVVQTALQGRIRSSVVETAKIGI
jgi:DNA-binding CsgD family transcriptional regulator